MSIITLLTLIFLVLKLCGVIAWGWLWVLSPLWIGALLWLLVILLGIAGFAFFTKRRFA